MRGFLIAAALSLIAASPAAAQTDRAYLAGAGGVAVSPDTTSGDLLAEVGVRVAPHLFAFGDVGRFYNLQPSTVQPAVDSTVSRLAGSSGLNFAGTARVPASYGIGGLRYEIPTRSRVSPYVSGGVGFARLSPTASFLYTSGPLPDGSTSMPGDDITSRLVTAGDFVDPSASNAFVFSLGGGVAVPVARHWAANAGYRFARVSADTPVNAQGAMFGLTYRF
jgi:opacity protein-like surface antigen